MKPGPEPEDDQPDEIKREDGLERYWLFYNGEWAETIFGLSAAIGTVLWCFLYILGFGESTVAYAIGGLAVLAFLLWYFVYRASRDQEGSGWKKRGVSTSVEKQKIALAVGLWIFIILFFGGFILRNRR
jgi:hypothetical protein